MDELFTRRSVRKYTDQKVLRDDLKMICNAGMHAPSAVNRQPWAFVIVDDKSLLQRLGEELPYAKMTKEASAAIVVCGNLDTTYPNKQVNYWVMDCAAATENMLLQIESMGLGAVWTAVFPEEDRVKIVRQILDIPDYLVPLNLCPIGYPAHKSEPHNNYDESKIFYNRFNKI
ncbi:MAG: nitroreductase family protein [Bacteroidaceae bacterium]